MLKSKKVSSLSVFLFAVIIVAISSASIVYPAFIPGITSESDYDIMLFEQGIWAVPFIVINVSLLIFVILYHYKALPDTITKSLRFVFCFDVSKRISIVLMIIIIGSYVMVSSPDLLISESSQWPDYTQRVKPALEKFPQVSLSDDDTIIEKLIVKNFLLVSSIELFGNVKIIPYLASIALLCLTYFFTVKISEKRLSGILALIILVQSRTFLEFDSTATYSSFWVLFYLLSLYIIYKKWRYLSALVYILSIFSKPLTIIFLPLSLFFISKADISKRRKILSCIPYLVISIIIIILAVTSENPKEISWNSSEFWGGFSAWVFQLRHDWVLFVFALPLIVGLYYLSRRGIVMADTLIMLIAAMLLFAPLLGGLSGFNIQPYRFVPLLVFFAVGVGLFWGKISSSGKQQHAKSNF